MRAEVLAHALGGRRCGNSWLTCCPAHDDRTPSLAIRHGDDGQLLVHCHAGCRQRQVIQALRARGLWHSNAAEEQQFVPSEPSLASISRNLHHENANRNSALLIWQHTVPAAGTLAELYLAARGIQMPLPATIRFHRGLRHPRGGVLPAMVALVTRGLDNTPVGIQRTFLTASGDGKAPVVPQRMMLGRCHGGAVRLAHYSEVLAVGEGLETSLSVMAATGLPTWAALSTSGLRALEFPPGLRNLIVLADGDDAGEAAALDCAVRAQQHGCGARIARPPAGFDFNDLLLGRGSAECVA